MEMKDKLTKKKQSKSLTSIELIIANSQELDFYDWLKTIKPFKCGIYSLKRLAKMYVKSHKRDLIPFTSEDIEELTRIARTPWFED